MNGLYASARSAIGAGQMDLLALDVRAILIDLSDYTPSLAGHQFLVDIPAQARVATSTSLTGKSITNETFFANPISLTPVSGDTVEAIVLYEHTGNQNSSRLIAFIDTNIRGFPFTPSDCRVTIRWHSAGIIRLSGLGQVIPPSVSSLGMNLGAVTYYADQIMFNDIMKQAPDWGFANGGINPPVDANGWPTALPGGSCGFLCTIPEPGGQYVVLFTGQGSIQPGSGSVVSTAPGRIVLNLTPGNNSITITSTGAGSNYMRNIRIVPIAREADYNTELFDPTFEALCRNFSMLRFMDTQQINNNFTVTTFASLPKTTWFSQSTGSGSSVEYMIALCNKVGADFWLNIYNAADDGCIVGLAEMVRDNLAPSLKVWVEYSNEVWNFEHGDTLQQYGVQYGISQGIPAQYPNEFDTRFRWQAVRSKFIFETFRSIVGTNRVRGILAQQMWDLRLEILGNFEINGVPAHTFADKIACAPYFAGFYPFEGPPEGAEHTALFAPYTSAYAAFSAATVAQGVAYCSADIDIQEGILVALKETADGWNKKLIGYEGGQHLASDGGHHGDAALQQKLDDINRHPDMYDAYIKYLNMWKNYGEIMMLYKLVEGPSIFGRWGHLENMYQQTQRPKWDALIDFRNANQRWWSDSNLPQLRPPVLTVRSSFPSPTVTDGRVRPPALNVQSSFPGAMVTGGASGISDTNIAPVCTPIGLVMGEGNQNILFINDTLDSGFQIYDSYNPGDLTKTFDFIGYSFGGAQRQVGRFIYITGADWYDPGTGGWWETLNVECATNAALTTWVTVGRTITPAYPFSESANGTKTYQIDFTPTQCYGVRISGNPGGTQSFIGCTELKLFEYISGGGGPSQLNVPALNVRSSFPSPVISDDRINPPVLNVSSSFPSAVVNNGSATFGTPISVVYHLATGHSLSENPMHEYMNALATERSMTNDYEIQIRIGSTISFRSLGSGEQPGGGYVASNFTSASGGYNKGGTRSGSENTINYINEMRSPTQIPAADYTHLVIAERHGFDTVRYEDTIKALYHYYTHFMAASPSGKGYLYHTWNYLRNPASLSNVVAWCDQEDAQTQFWECIASRINDSLIFAGRSDRLRSLPAAGALSALVRAAVTGSLAGITQGSVEATVHAILADEPLAEFDPFVVHLTPNIGHYFMACVLYSALYQRSPVGSLSRPSGVSAVQASSLQTVAWNYIRGYYTANPNGAYYNTAQRMAIGSDYSSVYLTYTGSTGEITDYQNFWTQANDGNPLYWSAAADQPSGGWWVNIP